MRRQDLVKRTITMEKGAWEKFDRVRELVAGKYSKNPNAQTLRRLIYFFEDGQYTRYE